MSTRSAGVPHEGAGGRSSTNWHTLSADEAIRLLESSATGLTEEEAEARLERFGRNRLVRVKPVSVWRILARQFASLVVMLLLSAAIVAFLLGERIESIAIAAVLAINTLIGFVVELRARRTMDALLRYEVPSALVMRAGTVREIPSDQLVPGDVILLEEGAAVPADARLITASELSAAEALLTGESLPVEKEATALGDGATPLAERTSMVYSGTTITSGRGSGVVAHTGRHTEMGQIGLLISEVESGQNPLEARLDALGHRLVWLTLAAAGVVTVTGVVRGAPLGLMVQTGIALAIAAVPEGLPAVATIALAVGLRRMAKRNALVRRLVAVEALGETTVVCTDKTGTLTAGEMTVAEVATVDERLRVTGDGFSTTGAILRGSDPVDPLRNPWLRELLEACALTSRASLDAGGGRPVGDPTDAALLVLAVKGGSDLQALATRLPLVEDVPFSSLKRSSASIHDRDGARVIFVKGSPATVLDRCESWSDHGVEAPLDASARHRLQTRNDELGARGLRVIAIAAGSGDTLHGLTLLGLVGIVDPPAEGVFETIQTLRRAGIRTVMATGDQPATAVAIAAQLGLSDPGDAALDGRDLQSMSDSELLEGIRDVSVLSRVSAEDKVRIVSALQAHGDIVAMIGDGVNDAAALKKSDIGVAMGGRGSDVAKETAAIVLTDDRFPTISAAVEEGRVIFDNIRKFVFYLFSCNVAEVMVLLVASVVGAPVPLMPLQILWLNIVTDTFPALALALEPAEPGVMRRAPRRPGEEILSARFLRAIGVYATLITGATLAAYAWGLSTGSSRRASTIAFMTLALAQLFHLGNARSREPVLAPRRAIANPWAVGAVPLVIALQLLTVYWTPLASLLGTVPLQASDWTVVASLSLMPAIVGQVSEVVQRRSNGGPAS